MKEKREKRLVSNNCETVKLSDETPFVVIEKLLLQDHKYENKEEISKNFEKINLEDLNKEDQVRYYYLLGKYNEEYTYRFFDRTEEKKCYVKAVTIDGVNTIYTRYAKYELAMIIRDGKGDMNEAQKLLEEAAGVDFVKPYLGLAKLYFYDIFCKRDRGLGENEEKLILDKAGEYAQMVLIFNNGCDEKDLKDAENIINSVKSRMETLEEIRKNKEKMERRSEEMKRDAKEMENILSNTRANLSHINNLMEMKNITLPRIPYFYGGHSEANSGIDEGDWSEY